MDALNEGNFAYGVRNLVRALNISRTSLLYYESLGLIEPHRNETTGYRSYGDEDYLKLFAYSAMRNIGISAKEATEMINREGDTYSLENLTHFQVIIKEKIDYFEAVHVALERQADAKKRMTGGSDWGIDYIPEVLFSPDNHNEGFDRTNKTPVNDKMLEMVPLSGHGAIFTQGLQEDPLGEWGYTIYSDLASFAFDEDDVRGLLRLGGCRCLWVTVVAGLRSGIDWESIMRVQEVVDEQALPVQGTPFYCHYLAGNSDSAEKTSIVLYLPLKE